MVAIIDPVKKTMTIEVCLKGQDCKVQGTFPKVEFPTQFACGMNAPDIQVKVTEILFPQCSCDNGVGRLDAACSKDKKECRACNDGFTIDVKTKTCKECTVSPDCEVVGDKTKQCSPEGYYACTKLKPNPNATLGSCGWIIPKNCECPNGKPVEGDDCPKDKQLKCASCDAGNYLVDTRAGKQCLACAGQNGCTKYSTTEACAAGNKKYCDAVDTGYYTEKGVASRISTCQSLDVC